jgi:CMP-N-acetylneuraminic acid synthetase
LPYSQNQIVQEATKIPQKAFEAYVKAVQLPLRNDAASSTLKNALHLLRLISSEARFIRKQRSSSGAVTWTRLTWKEATEYFSKLQKRSLITPEAAFTPVSAT